MLLFSSLVQTLKAQQRSPPEKRDHSNQQRPSTPVQASVLAKVLAANPKLMIELAIELTKLTNPKVAQPDTAATAVDLPKSVTATPILSLIGLKKN